jgi:HSP20 family protein
MSQTPTSIPIAHKSSGEKTTRLRIAPAVDVFDSNDGITIHADMPGCSAENLQIEVEEDTITIEGTATFVPPAGFRERLAENEPILYVRSFQLRPDLDRAKITASLRDGVLSLFMPRAEEKKARRIEVKLG